MFIGLHIMFDFGFIKGDIYYRVNYIKVTTSLYLYAFIQLAVHFVFCLVTSTINLITITINFNCPVF